MQDIAASLPARLLGDGRERRALDLCAAPGGKTMQLAAAGWHVTAIDASEARLERLRENLARTRLPAGTRVGDALTFSPAQPYDAVLLDAPCSATGIFRRHPDVLHRVRPKAIAALAERQRAMLARAAAAVAPGGTLVYAVCSLEPEEGERIAEAFLAGQAGFRQRAGGRRGAARRDHARRGGPGARAARHAGGRRRRGRLFVARFRRR